MSPHTENKAAHSIIPIESKVILGKESAAVHRLDKDKDADHEINALELGQMIQVLIQKEKSNHFHQRSLIGLIVAVVLLLCTTFASTWVAFQSSQKDVDADNEDNILISKRSGEALATLVHNPIVTVDFDYEAFEDLAHRRKLMSTDDFQRHLDETPVFKVPLQSIEDLWVLNEQGNLGALQFKSNSLNTNTGGQAGMVDTDTVAGDIQKTSGEGVVIGWVGRDIVTRNEYPSIGMIRYENIFIEDRPNTRFRLQCPMHTGDSLASPGIVISGAQSREAVCLGYLIKMMVSQDEFECFSPLSTVELEGGNIKSMQDLEIGDKVLVGPNKYQSIYSFGHKLLEEDAVDKSEFRKITVVEQGRAMSASSVLELTPDHLIYCHGEDTPIPASLLEETDLLVGKNGEVLHVHKIDRVYRHGLYAPLTADGKIVVGGVLASTYSSNNKNSPNLVLAGFDTGISWSSLGHAFIKPVAVYCTAFGSDGCHGEAYTYYGYNYATYVGVVLVKCLLAEGSNYAVQIIKVALSIITLALVAVAYTATCLLESYATLSVVIFFALGYVMMPLLESHSVPKAGERKKLLAGFTLKVKSA
mmetsp:Transcript_1980/g.5470  ORF Transcript_1980/g.5470 Transcript_1980/m.5470 type:complete len:587 (-) Transcript_1980:59-1819(-)